GRMTFFVDAVSAFGCESVDVGDCAISYCTSVPNKALEGPPGISFACVDINLYMSREHVPRNYYLDLSRYIAFDARLQTPTTPSIPQFRALQKALDLIEEEGIVNRRARYLSLSGRLIERLEPLGFRPVIKNQAHRSPAVTAFEVPEDVNADELNMFLRKKGFILWFPKHYHRQGTVR